jgi:hypothetical protein
VRARSAALVTRDPVLYAHLAGFLREIGVPVVSLLPGDRIPDRVALVLTSPEEAPHIHHVQVIEVGPELDRASLAAAIRGALESPSPPRELVIGLDPGPRPGYAVVADGSIVGEGTLEGPESAAHLAQHLRRRFPTSAVRFRIGCGDPVARDRIVHALWETHRPIEIVDERNTTPRGHRRPRDIVAARRIAALRGEPVSRRPSLRVTPGEIANLQRLSRESSGGDFTISRSSASRVLEGQMTMGEAIEEARWRYRQPETRRGEPLAPHEPL